MTSFRFRPKFELYLDKSGDQVTRILQHNLELTNHPFDATVFPGNFILRLKKEKQHYWSPQLSLYLEDRNEGCLITGRYQPHPNVWTLFILTYLAIGILIFFVSILGLTRLSLGIGAKVLWLLPILVSMGAGMYLVSQFGQKLGAEDTFDLHHFVENSLEQKIHIF